MAVDRLFYRKWTPVPWNIISYNVLRADNDSGPNVYGTEPWWFYLANLSLNFNVAFLLALMSLPLTVLLWWRSFESVVAGVNVKFLASTHGRPYQYLLMKLA
jgi:alpha-1,2-mannosyltransferase